MKTAFKLKMRVKTRVSDSVVHSPHPTQRKTLLLQITLKHRTNSPTILSALPQRKSTSSILQLLQHNLKHNNKLSKQQLHSQLQQSRLLLHPRMLALIRNNQSKSNKVIVNSEYRDRLQRVQRQNKMLLLIKI